MLSIFYIYTNFLTSRTNKILREICHSCYRFYTIVFVYYC